MELFIGFGLLAAGTFIFVIAAATSRRGHDTAIARIFTSEITALFVTILVAFGASLLIAGLT